MKFNSLKVIQCFIALFFISINLFADKIQVTSTTVGIALSTASPGDTIIFANGTYADLKLNLSNSGTSENPILFKPETLGGVVFNGSLSQIKISGDYWIIDGFKWENVQPNSADIIIYFSGASNNIFRNNTISNSGRITSGTRTGVIRLMKSSNNNILEYNRFDNLINVAIQVWAWDDDYLNTDNIIRYNYFTNHNSVELMQLGQGHMGAFYNQRTIVEHNLFEDFNMTDPELISTKTSFNIIRYNTFRNCLSMVVLRDGQNSTVEGNWFFNSRGIRVCDKNHVIINNYIEGIPAAGSNGDTEGIVLYCGDMARPNSNNGAQHYPADSVLVANNTIINHTNQHLIVGRNSSSWPYKPNGVTIKNNLVTNNVGLAIQNEASINSTWIQNMVYPTGTGVAGNVENVIIANPLLSLSGEIYKLQQGSPAIDNATNEALVSIDIEGQPRGASLDIGADEYSGANIIYGPLDETKVGPGHAAIISYSLNVNAVNGTVVKAPDESTYNIGTSVVLTATPNSGYTFTSWSGDATGSTNPLTVTMNDNKNITANFALNTTTYSLNLNAVNGTVVKAPNASTYLIGTSVVLTATPNTGYVFTSWSGDATGITNPLTVTMNANKNITANFVPVTTFTLNVTAINGTVVKVPNTSTYDSGTSVVLTATPNTGYAFISWSGDATSTTNPLTVTMNANKNITANFTLGTQIPIDTVWATTDDGNIPANTIDNDFNTRWSAKNGPHSITYKLHSLCNVEYLMIAWMSGDTRISYFDIEVSIDGETWTKVLTGGTGSGTTLQQEMVDIPDTEALYVRYVGNGNSDNSWNSITELDIHGTIENETAVDVINRNSEDTNLFQNYPNPFYTTTYIPFYLHTAGNVRLDVYDINGIRIVTLVDQYLQSGKHEIIWNAKKKGTGTIIPGVYFSQLTTSSCNQSKKMFYMEK